MDVVTRVREEMALKDIKQKDMIKILDVNQGTFAKWLSEVEKNRRDIPNTILAKMASLLNVDIEYLLGLQEEKKKINTIANSLTVEVMSVKASAGSGNNIEFLDDFSTGEIVTIDNRFFKTVPPKNIKCIQVDGYSMMPMLTHESWVIYKDVFEFETDGLYIINYDNQLMVKMIQVNFEKNKLDIISINKEYKSYSIDKHDQTVCKIVGKVLRCII